ncbi:MAG TPA: MBL fold metallo-hydrolase [Pirellulales bacterium]|nr:MBL fold metallo-hydrolase [Pirellulales bacterium]
MPLPSHPLTTDIRGQLVFLGTGTSVGVPIPGCDCSTCRSGDDRNQRTRCGLAVGLACGNLLVDTPTDLRSQLLREQIGLVHAVLYTHDHADHLFGLDDLRVLSFYLGGKLPLYCEEQVEQRIRRSFDYAFNDDAESLHEGAIPQLSFVRITTAPFELLGTRVVPIRLKHGRFDVLGFRFGNVAYCTDTNQIPDESWPLLEGLDVLVLDALRRKPHPTHLSLDEAIAVARRLRPRRTLFTHMSHDLEHAATNAALPATMELAYDGLKVPLT